MRDVCITGVGMTEFGKFPEASLRSLGTSAIAEALSDADLAETEVGLVVHANAVAACRPGRR